MRRRKKNLSVQKKLLYLQIQIQRKIPKKTAIMTLREIVKILNATVCIGENHLDDEVAKAFASDLMSDVLTLKETPILITGLCNIQTIRTCDMACLQVAVFVRNKKPTDDMIELAEENDMVLICCEYSMFKTCGLLYEAGLKPLY